MVFKAVRGSRIIVEPTPETVQTALGGIIEIIKTERIRPETGTIIQVGPGAPDNPMTLEPGDKVLFRKGAGEDISVKDRNYFIMLESDVHVVI